MRGIQVNTVIRSQNETIRGGEKKSTLKRLVSGANQQLLNFKTPYRLLKIPNAVFQRGVDDWPYGPISQR